MDIKPEHLDPAQKAAYDRVMGTAAPVSPQAPVAKHDEQKHEKEEPEATKVVAGGSGGGQLSPILVGVTAVLFFLIYTFIWLMVFGIKIPYLPF